MGGEELSERLFQFALGVLKLMRKIPDSKETAVIKYQLSKSSTSAGANYEEAQGAIS
ncbi:MAG TPA: four helix bundle protein [Bacteroidetes bacterium]|nr:four helix bundle protein [Bacteroidota bacterium]